MRPSSGGSSLISNCSGAGFGARRDGDRQPGNRNGGDGGGGTTPGVAGAA